LGTQLTSHWCGLGHRRLLQWAAVQDWRCDIKTSLCLECICKFSIFFGFAMMHRYVHVCIYR
jgi:hypothetical protein